jgi:Cytochrome P450
MPSRPRARRPGPELVRVEMEGRRISADEMISMVLLLGAGSETTTHLISGSVYVLLLGAGSETTIHLISGSVYELLKNPTLRDRLNEDRRRAGLAVEEFLRFVSPVQFTKPRFVRREVELGGVQLKRGDRIMAMLAAANMRGRSSSISSGGRIATSRSAGNAARAFGKAAGGFIFGAPEPGSKAYVRNSFVTWPVCSCLVILALSPGRTSAMTRSMPSCAIELAGRSCCRSGAPPRCSSKLLIKRRKFYPLANLRSACMMWHTLEYDVGPTPFSTTDAHRH